MSDIKNPVIESAIKEYETLNKISLEVYRYYVQILILIALGSGAAIVLMVNNKEKMTLSLLGILAILLTLFINTWVAGYIFLNLELWAHRSYLKKLEGYIRKQLQVKDDSDYLFNFYKTDMFGMYSEKMKFPFTKKRVEYHVVLDLCFIVLPVCIYAGSMYLSWVFGFNALAEKFFDAGNRKFCEVYCRDFFVVISLLSLVFSVWSKINIRKRQENRD